MNVWCYSQLRNGTDDSYNVSMAAYIADVEGGN